MEVYTDTDQAYYAQRCTEVSLVLLIPLIADSLTKTNNKHAHWYLVLLECLLVRWEFLTGDRHSVDALLPDIRRALE